MLFFVFFNKDRILKRLQIYLFMKKVTLFLHKKTHYTFPRKKSYFFLSIHFSLSSTTSVFVSLRGRGCIILRNDVLFTKEISNEIMLLCMDYEVAFRLEKTKAERSK